MAATGPKLTKGNDMPRTRGEYKKDNPLTKARANATRRTVNGKRIYPSHPDYPHAEVRECPASGVLADIRRKRKVLYGKADEAYSQAAAGYVYVVKHNLFQDMVKVGRSQDPQVRLTSAMTFVWPPSSIELVGMFYTLDSYKAEKVAHESLWCHKAGREWFTCGEQRGLYAAWEAAKRVNLERLRA